MKKKYLKKNTDNDINGWENKKRNIWKANTIRNQVDVEKQTKSQK